MYSGLVMAWTSHGGAAPPCQVDDLNRRTIHAERKEQDFKVRALMYFWAPAFASGTLE